MHAILDTTDAYNVNRKFGFVIPISFASRFAQIWFIRLGCCVGIDRQPQEHINFLIWALHQCELTQYQEIRSFSIVSLRSNRDDSVCNGILAYRPVLHSLHIKGNAGMTRIRAE
jgi:hypothetical protein